MVGTKEVSCSTKGAKKQSRSIDVDAKFYLHKPNMPTLHYMPQAQSTQYPQSGKFAAPVLSAQFAKPALHAQRAQ